MNAYEDVIYWASEGSSATLFSKQGSTITLMYTKRDQPFGLVYDWVGNRIVWIEDGENVSVMSCVFISFYKLKFFFSPSATRSSQIFYWSSFAYWCKSVC